MLRRLPNIISFLRMLLAVPIVMALAHAQLIATLWLFGMAAASDALDGYLARRCGWQSELGGILDPLADKVLLATVFVTLAYLGLVPSWLTGAVIARDAVIVLGALAYRAVIGPVAPRPSMVSKLNTLCQLVFVLVVIGTRQYGWPGAPMLWLGALVFVTVAVSCIDYVLVYGRRAAEEAGTRARPGAA